MKLASFLSTLIIVLPASAVKPENDPPGRCNGNFLVMNGGHTLSLQGLFRAAKKPHISTHLTSAFYEKSALPGTLFDAWEGVLLG